MIKESAGPESEKPAKWNRWFHDAQAGDKEAAANIIIAALPLIDSTSKDPYFRSRLGTDEIHSIAYYALVKFIKAHGQLPRDAEVPYLLRSIIRRDLCDSIRNLNTQEKFEQLAGPEQPEGSGPVEERNHAGCGVPSAMDGSAEPETHCMRNELCETVREAVHLLPESEKAIICGLYYHHKNIKEIAKDLRCSCQYVYKTRRNAYARLHKMLKETVQA